MSGDSKVRPLMKVDVTTHPMNPITPSPITYFIITVDTSHILDERVMISSIDI